MIYDVIIVGAGIAGLTAAIYTARANKSTLVLEAENFGGQIVEAPKVENFPGEEAISGAELMQKVYKQAVSFGAEIEQDEVINIKKDGDVFRVECADEDFEAKAIIIASGTRSRRMNIAREDELVGRGISFCATCDGALYKDKVVAVYGGGNSAVAEANYLADLAQKVYLIHHRDELRAKGINVDRLKDRQNVEFLLGVNITKLNGDRKLEGIELDNGKQIELDALFVAIGREASAQFVELDKDENGYIVADESCQTATPGIFAAGDIRTKTTRQLVTAAGDGAIAAQSVIAYLS